MAYLFVLSLLLSMATSLVVGNSVMANFETLSDSETPSSSDTESNDWPMFLYNAGHTSSPDDVAPITYDLLWRFNTMPDGADAWIIGSSPAVVGGVLYIGSDDGRFYALESSSGNLLWDRTLGSSTVSSPAVVKGVVYVSVLEGIDYAMNASTGEVIWNSSRLRSSSSPAVVNGLHYICSGSSVLARNATTGTTVWQSDISGGGGCSPVVVDDTVYVSDYGYACALDALNGSLKWTRELFVSATNNSPAVADGIVYVGCCDHTFYALDAETGTTIWTYDTGSSDGSAPTVAGGIVYVGSSPRGVFALNATNGALIWNYPSAIRDSSFALAGGILYACNSEGIHALDAENGTQIWVYAPSNTNINSAPTVANGILYVKGGDCYLYAFGKANQSAISLFPKVNLANTTVAITGAGFTSNARVTATFGSQSVALTNSTIDALGHFSGSFQINPSTTPGRYLISVTDNTNVTACANFTVVGSPTTSWPMYMHDPQHTGTPDNFVPTSNNTLWTYKVDRSETLDDVASSAAVVEGIVYTASLNGYVYAFDAYTGECYWKYNLPGLGTLSSPSVVDGVVYIGSHYGLLALNAYTGEKIWQSSDRVLMNSSPAVSGGLVFIGSFVDQITDEHAVYAFSVSNGQRVWKFTTSDHVNSSPAVVGNTVYVGCEDGYLYALNAVKGELIWKFNTGGANPYDSHYASPVIADGVVYTSTYHGNVFAIDSSSGSKIWNHSTGTLGSGFSSPVISNGVLYVAAKDFIYALNATTGDEIWRCEITSSVSPVIVGGVIYAGSYDSPIWAGHGRIWTIDTLTGAKTSQYATEGGIRVPVAIARGVIYVGTTQGIIYAIGTPDRITPQPTPAPTPTNYPIQTPTPTPTPTPKPTHVPTINPTTAPTQTTTNTPTAHPTATATPRPSQTPNCSSAIKATTNQGTKIEFSIAGNITSAQISNATLTTNQTTSKTTIAFTLTGQTGTTGFANITIPKNAILYGGVPTIYIDGVMTPNQGLAVDDTNVYVWFETRFSVHQIEIIFDTGTPTPSPRNARFQSLGLVEITSLTLMFILASTAIIVIMRSRRK
jgi:outer membrane protein assembly factor BamB